MLTVQTPAERIVPHDAAAEQRVLGSLLIDADAIFKVADILRVDDFYVGRHQRIYAAAQGLLERRERIDPLTVQMELARRDDLERLGGAEYLRELTEAVPTAVEVERHARAVRDRSLLRRLLGAATAIAADAYDEPTDTALTLDRAEQRIFALRDEATSAQLRHIQHALLANFDMLAERRSHPMEVSGVPSGFPEIDTYSEGFTAGELVIVAARPSVGKTSLALAMAHNMARRGTATLIFSLEMDTKQIVSRFLGLAGQSDLLALRTGNVLDTQAANALRDLPILIDDTPGISVMELRTKARRAMTNERLGAIVIDYLQLMRTDEHEENRVQELSTITRNLKSLARELGVVVIALSQLSRAAGDAGNEPKLSTLRECVTGDTLVCLTDGRRVPIRELVGTAPEVWSVDSNDRIIAARADLVWRVGVRPVFEVKLASGRSVHATAEHRLRTLDGWRTVRELAAGDRLAIARRAPEPSDTITWSEGRIALLGQLIGDGSYLSNAPMRYTTASEDNSVIVMSSAQNEFGSNVTRYSGRGLWHQLLISGNGNRWHPAGVNKWLRELGIFGQRSHEKRVPQDAFRLSNAQLALLLRHLWATDGTISIRKAGQRGSDGLHFSTNSPGLARDVAALLLRFEIVTRTERVDLEGYRATYMVRISGSTHQKRFLDIVGAFGPRVMPAQLMREKLANVRANTNVDTIPREIYTQVRTAMRARGITTRAMTAKRGTSYGGSSHFRFSPSRAVLAEYAEILDDAHLRELAASDLFWDRIVSIEPAGEQEVFDLTVPGPASWLADGVVSHNSGAIEQDSDIVLMLWRDKGEPPAGAPRLIHGSIAKNRNGPTGRFDLYFDSAQARFFSRASDEGMPV